MANKMRTAEEIKKVQARDLYWNMYHLYEGIYGDINSDEKTEILKHTEMLMKFVERLKDNDKIDLRVRIDVTTEKKPESTLKNLFITNFIETGVTLPKDTVVLSINIVPVLTIEGKSLTFDKPLFYKKFYIGNEDEFDMLVHSEKRLHGKKYSDLGNDCDTSYMTQLDIMKGGLFSFKGVYNPYAPEDNSLELN